MQRPDDRAFEALIVSQLRMQCQKEIDQAKLPPLTDAEKAMFESIGSGSEFLKRLKAASADNRRNDVKPSCDCQSHRHELVGGLNRAEQIDEQADEELSRQRDEAFRELEKEKGQLPDADP